MFSFEEYFRSPFTGRYALRKGNELDGQVSYWLCDNTLIIIHKGVEGDWVVDDTRKPFLASRKHYKHFSNAFTRVVMLNAKVIERLTA